MTGVLCAASPFAAPPTRQTTPRADWPRPPVSRPQTPLSAPRPRPPANNKQSSKILGKKGGEGGEEKETRATQKPILRALRESPKEGDLRRRGRGEGEPTWGDGSCRTVAVSGEESWRAPCGARLAERRDARARERQDSGLRGGARLSEGEESKPRWSGAGGAGRHVREEGGRAPYWLARARGAVAARACLPAHVGVIFKWNVVLAARLSGGRVGPPALAVGRGRPAQRPLPALLTGQPGCPYFGLPAPRLARPWEPNGEFRALPKPLRRSRVSAAESCIFNARFRLPHSHSGNKATYFLFALEARPGWAPRPQFPEPISHAHILPGTVYPGREVDCYHLA